MVSRISGDLRYDKRYTGWFIASLLATVLGISIFLLTLVGQIFGVPIGIASFFLLSSIGLAGLTMYYFPRAFYRPPSDVETLLDGWPKSLYLGLVAIFILMLVSVNVLHNVFGWGTGALRTPLLFLALVFFIAVLYIGWWSGKVQAELDWRNRRGELGIDLPVITSVITRKSEDRAIMVILLSVILIFALSRVTSILSAIGTVGGFFSIVGVGLYFLPKTDDAEG